MGSCKFLLLITFFFFLHILTVYSLEFEVGDNNKGWVVPSSSKDEQMYNQWASENRFQIGNSVRFKYKKDSIMVVTDAEYEKCHSSHPIFFSNNGDTVFKLEHSGLFYFISGVTGHCERGQKMIIKVLEPEIPPSPPPPPSNQNSSPDYSGAVEMATTINIMQFIMFFLGFIFIWF